MQPSLLAITSELPWPLDSGGRLRTFHLQAALSRECDVRLIVPVLDEQRVHVETLRGHGITIIPVPVKPRTKLGELQRLIRSRRRGEPYVMYGRHDRDEVRAAVARELRPGDIVWLDHIDSLIYKPVKNKCVIDLHNIYSLIPERMAKETSNPLKRLFLHGEARRLTAMERRAMACDTVLAVSSSEAAHFRVLGTQRVIVAPNGVDCAAFAALPAGRMDAKPVVLFLGTLNWGPNVSAALHMARVIFPKVLATLPEAELWLVGRDPAAEVRACASTSVIVTGSVPAVLPYLKDAALLAVPLDAGGGTRLKILEAFAAGLPVVSTQVGAEGIDAIDGQHLVIAEREAMAAAIIRLLCDASRGAMLAEQARELALRTYDWARIGAIAVEAVHRESATDASANRR